MNELFRYEGDEVDVNARDLPGLKARFIVDHVPDRGVVLDIGCGGGKMLRTLARERPAAQLHGCDLRRPAEQSSSFEFRLVDDPDRLPYDDASIDTVLVVDVFEHVHQPEAFVREVSRVLRPSGLLVGFMPAEGQRFGFYRLYRAALGDDLYAETKGHIQAFSRSEVISLLEPEFEIFTQRFAYHFFGQLMDASLCAMLRVPFVKRMFWNESPYHNRNHQPTMSGRIFAGALVAANRIAWAESTVLANVSLTSAGILLSARRR